MQKVLQRQPATVGGALVLVIALWAMTPAAQGQVPMVAPGNGPGPVMSQPRAGGGEAASTSAPSPSIIHRIRGPNERLELTVNTSRILTLDQKIPQAQVNNPDLLELHPLSPNELQVFGKAPGVTQINLWSETQKIYTIDVIVYGDAQALMMTIKSLFPNAVVRAIPVSNGVILAGYVDQPEHVSKIVEIAQEYYPKVINNMQVAGTQQVLLHVKVMEVSRTKLRSLGFDFAQITNGSLVYSSVSGLIGAVTQSSGVNTIATSGNQTLTFRIAEGNSTFFGVLRALRQDNLMKVLAEPTLVTVSGRPAFFQVGGEIPILVPESLGTVAIEYKKYGTQIDFVPIVLGNGRIRLEVKPRVSEIDPTRSVTINSTTVPGMRVREVETGVEMVAGQTLAIAGLVQNRVDASHRGFPVLADVPYLGAAFRSVQEENNEIELMIMVTPELAEAVNACDMPPCGPGLSTRSPNDWDLFLNGHLEVPNCCPPGGQNACPPSAVDAAAGGDPMSAGLVQPAPAVSHGPPPLRDVPAEAIQTPLPAPTAAPAAPTQPTPPPAPMPKDVQNRRPTSRPTDVGTAGADARPAGASRRPSQESAPTPLPAGSATTGMPTRTAKPARGAPATPAATVTSDGEPAFLGPVGYERN